ncbi:unnamed protein product [Parnassius apollo]|uniref:(apollo) hypothetical protein n=1 Tax=Parnassius apollo TaxID=110799 RepID=A0A8S3Y5Q0_PARAO|nr:unnamed protein product [Parnassius apollo]
MTTKQAGYSAIYRKHEKPTSKSFKSIFGLFVYLVQMARSSTTGTQFASHISVNTPSRSFSHGVGDPLRILTQPMKQQNRSPQRNFRRPVNRQSEHYGYPRVKPSIPFPHEDIVRDNAFNVAPLLHHNYFDVDIPLLPPSPYKVDSPDPESLWPQGLFVPPFNPPSFVSRRLDNDFFDPYLLEGSEAVAAVQRSNRHGLLYFHDIPHIESLLANQYLRIKNNLKPNRIGSIRHTWPNNRP